MTDLTPEEEAAFSVKHRGIIAGMKPRLANTGVDLDDTDTAAAFTAGAVSLAAWLTEMSDGEYQVKTPMLLFLTDLVPGDVLLDASTRLIVEVTLNDPQLREGLMGR